MARPRLAIVSAISAFGSDADTPPLIEALEARGAIVDHVAWDDPTVSWGRFDRVVLRSPWDYTQRRGEFLAWCARAARSSLLLNPEPVLRWNTDKRYLAALGQIGVPVVPTRMWSPGEPDGEAAWPDWPQIVVKPCVGAGSRGVARFVNPTQRNEAIAHARALRERGGHVMLQPYLEAVDTIGETALVFIGGVFSHAVRKAALLDADGGRRCSQSAPDVISPCTADAPMIALGESVLAGTLELLGLDAALPYARVDLLPGENGPCLLELELTEPSLFLAHRPSAAGLLADAILSAR